MLRDMGGGFLALDERFRFTFGVEAREREAYADEIRVEEGRIETPLGPMEGCVARSKSGGVELELRVGRSGERRLLRLSAKNSTQGALTPQKLILIRTDGEGIGLSDLSDWALYKNGIRKNDCVSVHSFGDPAFDLRDVLACGSDDPSLELGGTAGSESETGDTRLGACDSRIGSAYMSLLRSRSTGSSLLFGFLTLRDQFGFTRFSLSEDRSSLDEFLAYTAVDAAAWGEGETLESEWLLIDTQEAFDAIAAYASDSGRLAGARHAGTVPTGWCSWYFFYESVTEEDVLRNARFIRENHLPVKIIQIDMGWEERLGDWYPNHRFPRGMGRLTDELHGMGFQAGLWISPFWVEPRSEVHRDHSEWLLRGENGKLEEFVCHIPGYVIDTSIPEACAWIEETARRITRDWGFDYIKTDFLRAPALSAKLAYRNPVTRSQALRCGLEALRRGAGDRFILGCGGQYGPTVGLLDGNRTSNDISASWAKVKSTFKKNILRWWMQPAWGLNDADCLIVRGPGEGLPGYQSGVGRHVPGEFAPEDLAAIAELFYAGGGLVMLGDDLPALHPKKIEALRAFLSPDGVAAIPRDMFERPIPCVLHKKGGSGETVSIINWEETPRTFRHTVFELTGRKEGSVTLLMPDGSRAAYAAEDIVEITLPPHGAVRLEVM